MPPKTIIFASDHRGIELREALVTHAQNLNLSVKDIGVAQGSPLDYVDITKQLTAELNNQDTFGVLICGNGQGTTIAANRSTHIRAALCRTPEDAEAVRNKINANVLCLGSEITSTKDAIACLTAFINAPFDQENYGKRLLKLTEKPTQLSSSGVNLIVRAIIIHEGHVLLTTPTKSNLHFATDLYFLPGGHVEYTESAPVALRRELMEEMGIEVDQLDFAGALEACWDRKGHPYHEINLVYRVHIPGLSLTNPPEALHPVHQFVWYPLAKMAVCKILPEKLSPLILKASENNGSRSIFMNM